MSSIEETECKIFIGSRRNSNSRYRIYTPNARTYLVDYVARLGNDHEALKSYSTFKLSLELLYRFGADFNLKNSKGVAPVLYLLRDRDKANPGYLDDIMDYGVDVNNAEDNEGSTPFLEAVYAIDKIVKLDIERINHNSPLDYREIGGT